MSEMTRLPRWCAVPGTGAHEFAVEVPLGIEALAIELDVPHVIVFLAAYLHVVGFVAGEDAVTVGYRDGAEPARQLSLEIDDGSWRDLVAATASRCADDLASRGPLGYDTTFGVDDAAPLSVRPAGTGLTIRYDASAFDAEHIARFASYLATTLTSMYADPGANRRAVDLLSGAERSHQIDGTNGPHRAIPDARFHQLFAAHAHNHPDAIAAICRDQVWTYGQLNRAANRIAHALLADGLQREGVVAVATERGLPWMAAIIGVFKAGGVYLPVEPDWPGARVASLLRQSGARIVLTESGGHPALDQCPGLLAHVAGEIPPDDRYSADDPTIDVAARDAAYIYFTSGSTGTPKGATCEHLGMLNHLFAKIDDLRIGADDVVVQSTQSSFDISLWQLIAALLVGGRTVIVPRRDALDVPHFLDLVVSQRATVAQVVPSFLDVILDHVQHHPRDLGRLREMSVTGEAITRPLIARWFGSFPSIRLINAYGATEVSDDTTHEIMTEPPPDEVVPVGRPLNNVAVSVLGPGDDLVPLGSAGEIVFSGICVGRGYINDEARTKEAFGADPHRPGTRMYRTGDFGRWLPGGKLGFYGRRDEQVKIHGIRIELGEVESRVLEHPQVRASSVVAVPVPGLGKELVAFYTAAEDLAPDAVRDYLARVLPPGYVPKRLYQILALPLTANGKVDKKSLIRRALAGAPATAATGDLPATPTEQRIARTWATVLDVPLDRIGRNDHFFEVGGSSLAALRMVAALDGLVALVDVIGEPVLGALAARVDQRSR